MKTFIIYFNELLQWQTLKSATPRLTWYKNKYRVFVYYSDFQLNRMGAEIIF